MGYQVNLSLQKKKNVIILGACVMCSFIMYQVYCFLAIAAITGDDADHLEEARRKVIPLFDSEHDIRYMDHEDTERLNPKSAREEKRPNFNKLKTNYPTKGSKKEITQSTYTAHEQLKKNNLTFDFLYGMKSDIIDNYFYRSPKIFKCLNSEQTIPFSQLNDDYCDCEDGTDEPGTAACPNTRFFCLFHDMTPGKGKLKGIPSGKVGDGICDCCDGTDEFRFKHDRKLALPDENNVRHYVSECPKLC